MKKGLVFSVGFCCSIFAAGWLWDTLITRQFDGAFTNEKSLTKLERINTVSLARVKFDLAREQERADIGIFGNSRSVQAGRLELSTNGHDIEGARVFNFSVPGTSIRTSAVFLEQLAEIDKLPELSLISLDHLYLEFDGMPEFPGFLVRLQSFTSDLSHLLPDSSVKLFAKLRFAWRYAWNEWTMFEGWLNFARLILDGSDRETAQGTVPAYRIDGSRFLPEHRQDESRDIAPMQRPDRSINLAYLRLDLLRLSQIAKTSNAKIIVYESPLHPSARLTTDVDNREATLRSGVEAACAESGLTCVLSSNGIDLDWPVHWDDATHAPSEALGVALGNLVRDAGRE